MPKHLERIWPASRFVLFYMPLSGLIETRGVYSILRVQEGAFYR